MAIVVSPALRRPASAVPSITGLRISPPGFKATLVNISPSGLVAEWGLALKIGQTVTIAFEGTVTDGRTQTRVVGAFGRNRPSPASPSPRRFPFELIATTINVGSPTSNSAITNVRVRLAAFVNSVRIKAITRAPPSARRSESRLASQWPRPMRAGPGMHPRAVASA